MTDPLKCIESLVHINKKLGQPEAAQGILTHAEKKFVTVDVKEDWLSKLGRWEVRPLSVYLATIGLIGERFALGSVGYTCLPVTNT